MTLYPLTAALIITLTPAAAVAWQNGPVSHPVSSEARSASNKALQATLFDLIALRHAAHQEHWNVVGSDFYQLHEFYAELYQGLDAPIDTLAERMRVLGSPADGRPSSVGRSSSVRAPAVALRAQQETLQHLHKDFSDARDRLYEQIDETSDDPVTQDVLIGVARLLDTYTWQLRAHLG
ncbi:MAG: DNA starvation/stationary phase protection protein [Parvularcula sp.]|nr:DNA starvation/stationary phase protection protein [Parvularcula sp.]